MLDNSEVRAHIRKGEQAVTLLTSLGYTYKTQSNAPHVWEAPTPTAEDTVTKALKDLVRDETAKAFICGEKAGVKKAQAEDPRGPNWHLVEGLVGKDFAVRPENIPVGHALRSFGFDGHFRGRHFNAIKIEYRRDPSYSGYAVTFRFNTRPYRPETVWIPLSACAFRP